MSVSAVYPRRWVPASNSGRRELRLSNASPSGATAESDTLLRQALVPRISVLLAATGRYVLVASKEAWLTQKVSILGSAVHGSAGTGGPRLGFQDFASRARLHRRVTVCSAGQARVAENDGLGTSSSAQLAGSWLALGGAGTLLVAKGERRRRRRRSSLQCSTAVHSFVLAFAGPPLARGALTLTHGGPLRSRAELGPGPAVHPIGSLSPRGAA